MNACPVQGRNRRHSAQSALSGNVFGLQARRRSRRKARYRESQIANIPAFAVSPTEIVKPFFR
jgi:hypothetical protein